MKGHAEIQISIEIIDIINAISNPDLILNKLQENGSLAAISTYILDKITDKDGSPHLVDYRLTNLNYSPDTNQGKFRLHFIIERTFCCSDIESAKSDYIDFSFSLNHQELIAQADYFIWGLNN